MADAFKSGNPAFEKWWSHHQEAILSLDHKTAKWKRLWYKAWIQEGLESKP